MSWRTTPDDSVPVLISSFWEIMTAQIIRSQMTWRTTSAWSVPLNRKKNPKVSAKTVVVPEHARPINHRDKILFCPGRNWDKKFLSPSNGTKQFCPRNRFLSPGQSFKFESSPPIVGISSSSGRYLPSSHHVLPPLLSNWGAHAGFSFLQCTRHEWRTRSLVCVSLASPQKSKFSRQNRRGV